MQWGLRNISSKTDWVVFSEGNEQAAVNSGLVDNTTVCSSMGDHCKALLESGNSSLSNV